VGFYGKCRAYYWREKVNQFSVSEFTTFHLSIDEEIELLLRMGITGIDIAERKLSKDVKVARDQIARVISSGLTVTGFIPRVHALLPDSLNPQILDLREREESFKQSLAFVGSIWPNHPPVVLSITGAASNLDYKTATLHIVEAYSRLAEFAGTLGITIVFEPLNPILMNSDTVICSWSNSVKLVSQIGANNFKLVFDTWHIWDEYAIYKQFIDTLDLVGTVHVSDWLSPGPRSFADRGIPGEGEVDWVTLAETFKKSKYSGPIVLEIFSSDEFPDSLWQRSPFEVIDVSRKFLETTFGTMK